MLRSSPPCCRTARAHAVAGRPLLSRGGTRLGTLCVVDRVVRDLDTTQRRALETLGRQVEAQLELRLKVRQLEQREALVRSQRDALERLQRDKDELPSLVVHDLKNPIASIIPNAQFLFEEALSDDTRVAARDIGAAAAAMHRMVLDLLDISRSEGLTRADPRSG